MHLYYRAIVFYRWEYSRDMPTRQEVREFLTAFKLAIGHERWNFKGRERTEQDLINLNLTGRQVAEIICGLTPTDYSAGPHRPDNGPLGVRVGPRGY